MQTAAVGGEQWTERHAERVQTGFPGMGGLWVYSLHELMSLSTSQREISAVHVGMNGIPTSGWT